MPRALVTVTVWTLFLGTCAAYLAEGTAFNGLFLVMYLLAGAVLADIYNRAAHGDGNS